MKYLLGVLSVLLVGLATTTVHADYIVIIANLTASGSGSGSQGVGPGGVFQPGGKGAAPGTGGGAPGLGAPGLGGGAPGTGGGARPGGGAPGGDGRGPGTGGGGAGFGGPPPGMTGPGGGGFGGPPPGMTGPGGGGFGGPLPGMGVPGQGNFNAEEFDDDVPPLYVVQPVEVRNWSAAQATPLAINLARQKLLLRVEHRWGHTILYDGGLNPQSSTDNAVRYVSIYTSATPNGSWLGDRYTEKRNDLKNAQHREQALLRLAQWCLARGLIDDTHLGATVAMLGDAHKEQPAHEAFKKVKDFLGKPAADNPRVDGWLRDGLLSTYKVSKSEHFVLIHNLTYNREAKEEPPEVITRLHRLEDAYKTYYYWLALKCDNDQLKCVEKDGKPVFVTKSGQEIRFPEQRLPSILVGERGEFLKIHQQIFGNPPLGADGFYAQRTGLAVYSNDSLDPLYKLLSDITRSFTGDAGTQKRTALLRGDAVSLMQDKEHLYSQTAALMLRAMDADSELASVSHDATCQLITASGLLPRGVVAPQWIEMGMGEYFGTPKGSVAPCATGPNPVYLPHFKKLDKKLDPVSELKNTITDRLWRQTGGGKDGPATLKAKTMSWALTYYLAENKLPGLCRYYQELSRLPRDVEFDEDVLLRCFGRAFELMDKDNPNQLSEERLQTFATEWKTFILKTVLEEQPLVNRVKELQVKGPPPKPQQQQQGTFPGPGGGGNKGGGQ